jgi:hypothetical protein
MPDHDDDFRSFINAQNARAERVLRDLGKIIDRNTTTIDRNTATHTRTGQVLDKVLARLDADEARRADEVDERRAFREGYMQLIDKISEIGRKIDPGDAPGPAAA